jgi:hypothetical protein
MYVIPKFDKVYRLQKHTSLLTSERKDESIKYNRKLLHTSEPYDVECRVRVTMSLWGLLQMD